jgi:putative Ig domain-containing protein
MKVFNAAITHITGGYLSVHSRAHLRAAVQRFVVLAALVFTAPAFAANYPMELVSPRAVGTAPVSGNAAITAGNRIFKAYPGIEYNIRAVVIGGAYPYSFTLSGAPAGMTINSQTGEIRWPSPTGTTATPTISVTDSEGTQRSSPWTIAVTTAGFKFVDAVNGSPSGNGSITSPWRTVGNLMGASSAVAGDIVYFRNGVYSPLELERHSVGTPWERVEIEGDKPNAWIAYPGEAPIFDFGFNPTSGEPGVLVRFWMTNMYIDGFETRNSRIIGFQVNRGSYGVFRRLRMHDHNMIRANLDGANASYIMTLGGQAGDYCQYLAIQNNEFYNAPSDMALKIYQQWKMVIENNLFRDLNYGTELKADIPQFTYRANTHLRIPGRSIGGNMNQPATHGEINFNLTNTPSGEAAFDVNQDGMATRIDVYRNTFVGRVQVRPTDAADGPFRFYDNVIISSDSGTPAGSRILNMGAVDQSRIFISNNLTGAPGGGIVDANGLLTSAYAQYRGVRGHELANVVRPRPPTNARVE